MNAIVGVNKRVKLDAIIKNDFIGVKDTCCISALSSFNIIIFLFLLRNHIKSGID